MYIIIVILVHFSDICSLFFVLHRLVHHKLIFLPLSCASESRIINIRTSMNVWAFKDVFFAPLPQVMLKAAVDDQ